MTDEELRALVLETLKSIAPDADLDTLDPDVAFADQFDFDSVDCLSLATSLSKQLNMTIPEGDCPRLSTLNGCVAYLRAKC